MIREEMHMKLGMLAAAAVISAAGVTGASAQVYIAEPYAAEAYVAPPVYAAPVAPPVYAAPAPLYAAPPVVMGERVYVTPPVSGYVPPRYTYTINSPRRGVVYTGYRELGGCVIGPDGYCY
jgi:hypothetical protein